MLSPFTLSIWHFLQSTLLIFLYDFLIPKRKAELFPFFFQIVAVEYIFRNGGPVMIVIPKTSGQKIYWLSSVYNALAVFIFGSVVTQFLTELTKHSVGRLRPHFYTLCDPIVDDYMCSTGYVTEFECRSKDEKMLKEARYVNLLVFPICPKQNLFYTKTL